MSSSVPVSTPTENTQSGRDAESMDLPEMLRLIRREIRDEYLQPHDKPWVVGFSGGKDSTLLLHLVLEAVQSVAPADRKRRIFVLSNDTRVESPIFQSAVDASLERIREGVEALRLPVEVHKTHPDDDGSFWFNLLGKGYPAPNRNFRWCTDRMKIRPTTRFIQTKISEAGEVILLLGVRKGESASRSARLNAYNIRHGHARLHPHNDFKGCFIFKPIEEFNDTDVWQLLLTLRPPWGGTHKCLVTMYKNAKGGECPMVMSDDDAPSCGSNSARFGCWTCTVVDKDASIDGLIDSGFEHLLPLADFRERLKSVSGNPDYRSMTRRNGAPGLGPLTLEARQMLLEELLKIQKETEMSLISTHEEQLIRHQWTKDETDALLREHGRWVHLTTRGEKS